MPYALVQDPYAAPEYEARCVAGDDADCGAVSGRHVDPGPVEEWQRRHTQETGHTRYRRTFVDYAVMEPPAGPPAGLEPAHVARVTARGA
ncbi:hypothetical protein ACFWZ2_39760 [Streptomyces sp. NPDC059002]|uniref:DUF7848 domain-containing protein n=1 Tax=Streptomyces sp. NPDC059002 TaxID=3346690 RepID=UPI0036951FE3